MIERQIAAESLFKSAAIYILSLSVASAAVVAGDNTRSDQILESGWRFEMGDPKDAETTGFDDAGWQEISIPHNWGWEEAQRGEKNYPHGTGWYRRELDVMPEEGRRYFLKFEAASLVADVHLNGKHLGQHRGGFSAFTYEITDELAKDGKNLLAMRVSNKKEPDIAPLGGDFNIYGGLYRPVHLIETPAVCFALTDRASPGVTWLQTCVSKEEALLDMSALVSNGTHEGLEFTHFPPALGETLPQGLFTLSARLIDADGKTVTNVERQINVTPEKTAPYDLRLVVKDPYLWHGTSDPYLYTAMVELRSAGKVVDAVGQKIGLRWFHVDPENGFFLNGEPYRVRGVSKHQDRKDKGWAVSNADMEEDIVLIKEMGANSIRLSHYQHSDHTLTLCDREGILIYSEVPQVGAIGTSAEFIETSRGQLLDMIRQNINHCSVFAWGLFNEVHVKHEDPHVILRDQKRLAHGEDPTRPTIGATSHAHSPAMNRLPDLLGWNRYPGWYDPLSDLSDLDMWDKYAPTSRHGGFCFTEYGAGANIEHHEQNPGQPVPAGFWHPEEWQSLVHEAHWSCFSRKPYVWGTYVWNMFDFYAAKRREGGKVGVNDKGLVTSDRKVKKDAFYFYKANWSEEPVLHLTSKRHTVRHEQVTPVKVYSNCGDVTLTVNGKEVGTVKPDEFRIARWEDIQLAEGENKVVVSAGDLRDEAVWTYDPNAKTPKPETDPEKVKRVGGDGGFGQ